MLLSILVNAIDAMNSHAMEDDTTRSKEIFIRTWTTENQRIHIGIKNTGPRIPADIQAKIFDPFFTTKPIGSGTGLGLAIAYQTPQNHNGSIRVNTVPNRVQPKIYGFSLGKNSSSRRGRD